jgi:hypothetical protein
MNKFFSSATIMFMACMSVSAGQSIDVTVNNKSKAARQAAPVVIQLNKYGNVKSALVTSADHEIPCQLDDLNGDGIYDELCFITDVKGRSEQKFHIVMSDNGEPRKYEPQVYAEMMMTNKKITKSNKQDLYISSLTTDRGVNPYWMMHHHGPAFESKLVAYRIYFDHRQTVDIYGKYHQGLELKQTQFYPDMEQKAAGFGDDILWVGETLGMGTLRGWDGKAPTMISDVEHRTERIVARGPLRTIVEVVDNDWKPAKDDEPVDMTTRYTLYADHRDCAVDIKFNRPVNTYKFATGIINVKNSVEYSDQAGLRGCWGTDWPVSEKDSAGHKRETVGLGICIPKANIVSELAADKDNYPFVVNTPTDCLHYDIAFGSDNEDYGYHSAKEWFKFLKEWKNELNEPIEVMIN